MSGGGGGTATALPATATTEIGIAVRDPRHMNATRTFAGWPAVALHVSRRVRLDLAAATAGLPTLLVFALPNELHKAGIALAAVGAAGLRRGDGRGELSPAERNACRRAMLW